MTDIPTSKSKSNLLAKPKNVHMTSMEGMFTLGFLTGAVVDLKSWNMKQPF